MRTVIMKVWNKTVTIQNVPDYVTTTQLEAWAKKKLIIDSISKQTGIAG